MADSHDLIRKISFCTRRNRGNVTPEPVPHCSTTTTDTAVVIVAAAAAAAAAAAVAVVPPLRLFPQFPSITKKNAIYYSKTTK